MTRFALPLGLAHLAMIVGCGGRPPASSNAGRVEIAPPIVAAIAPRSGPTYAADVAPAIDRYCLECHGSATRRGGVALDHFEGDAASRETWGRVADVLQAGTMPPSGRAQPLPTELATINDWLAAEVVRCDGPDADPGRVTMRRLNRAEYNNTIRDLLGLVLDLADAFPADDVGDGFDNSGDVLSIPPILLEKYLQAADLALEAAASSPRVWSRIMNPSPDTIPPAHRKLVPPVRTEPVKRIGRPAPAPPAAIVDEEALALRRAYQILRAFADRAYRRPATVEELTRLVGLVEAARKDGDDFDQAIRYALKAVLIAPSFLFLVEEDPATIEAGKSAPLGEFELATRLSYFLWSSCPDDELYGLAARGELQRGGNLAKQVRRMLRDEKAQALVDGFATQWLQIRALKEMTPDPQLLPDFDEPLRQAMLDETRTFAAAIIRDDRSVLDFLTADYTFVNERLARHYGIPGVVGDHFRRVPLTDTRRGGVLTHASVLTITSNPTRTSPTRRGKWILDNFLGMPPPPPPEGVAGLGGDEHGDPTTSLRQRMERHRADPNCASCHARMDPLGFGLENFDAIGAWRSSEGGGPLDVSGSLPGGGSFRNPAELRALLVARREQFAGCLAEKLLTYALGRGTTPADRCFIAEIVHQSRGEDYRFSSLGLAIVASPPFQTRKLSQGPR